MADTSKPIPMRGPTGCAPTLSHEGKTYAADKLGLFAVPIEAVEILVRHGFRIVEQKP